MLSSHRGERLEIEQTTGTSADLPEHALCAIDGNRRVSSTKCHNGTARHKWYDLASCVPPRGERSLAKVPGVASATVNLATERATVGYDPATASPEDLVTAVERAGYGAESVRANGAEYSFRARPRRHPTMTPERRASELRHKRNILLLGIGLTVPVVLLSMFFMDRFPGENMLLLALTAPVWGYVGWDFHRTAIRVLRHGGTPDLDVLVSLGSTAAFLMSVLSTVAPQVVGNITFYDTTALIIRSDISREVPRGTCQRPDQRGAPTPGRTSRQHCPRGS